MQDHRHIVLAEPDIKLNALDIVVDRALETLHRVFWAKEPAAMTDHYRALACLLLKAIDEVLLCNFLHSH